MQSFLWRFVGDESGGTLIEYGVLAAAIAVACIGAVALLGTSVQALYTSIGVAVAAAL